MSSCCCASEPPCRCDTEIQTVSAEMTAGDIWGAIKVRFGIGRMDYKAEPGLYAMGKPDKNSPVLVSANYKLSFDILRSKLSDFDCWLLILDTKGINVWCAAGKGTFGTSELINSIKETALSEIVTHRKLILPQLGASGVSAHDVERQTGFSVTYGPIRASDIKTFISSGYKATKEMRTVNFTMLDRLILTPMEIVEALRLSFPVLGVLFLLNLFAVRPFGAYDLALYSGSIGVGAFLVPVLLPFIPGKLFAFKGWLMGLFWTAFALWLFGWHETGNWLLPIGYLLLLPMVSAYLAMNFTGCSTFTSPSGVIKEMKISLPFIIGGAIIGAVIILINNLFTGGVI